MKNQLIPLSGDKFKTLGLTNERLFLSEKKERQFEGLQKTAQNASDTSKGKTILLEKISKLQLNTGDAAVKISYQDYTKKSKTIAVELNNGAEAKLVAAYLGKELNLQSAISQEKAWLPLLKNVGWLTLTIGLTYYMATMDDASGLETSGGRKARGGAAILRMIYDLVGQIGVLLIGTLIAIVIGYMTYKRFKNPENNIVYIQ